MQWPTGYGKTLGLAVAYRIYRELQIVNRVIVVVPTTTQREQYEDGFKGACAKLGMHITGVKRVDGDHTTLRYHRENRAEVFVIGVDKLRANLGYIHDLMGKGRWLLVADEHHHYASDKAWGEALKELDGLCERTLAMSATPLRNDGSYSIFGKPTPGLAITLKEAVKEQACKTVRAHIEHYFVDVTDSYGEVTRITTETLRHDDTLPTDLSAWETKKQLRYLDKYVSPLLSGAVNCWMAKQIENPGQHQMIIYAMTCKHAQSLVKSMRLIGLGAITADWIGVGPDGRSDDDNRAVIKRFQAGTLDCLVQVNKAGEGFDVCRASVLVFANLYGNCPASEQFIGRGLRRNFAIADYDLDVCDLFIPADSELVELARCIEDQTRPERQESTPEPGEPREGDYWATIPEWQLVNAQHDRSETVWVVKADDPRVKAVAQQMEPHYRPTGERYSPDDPEFLERIAKGMTVLLQQQNTPSEDELLAVARKKTEGAVRTAAGSYARYKAGLTGSFEKTLIGDVVKNVHGYWKRQHRGHDAMVLDEFRQKYEWVSQLNEAMKRGEVPSWLAI